MLNQFSRTQLLLGEEAMDKLKNSRVAVFGVGGVGGAVCSPTDDDCQALWLEGWKVLLFH